MYDHYNFIKYLLQLGCVGPLNKIKLYNINTLKILIELILNYATRRSTDVFHTHT